MERHAASHCPMRRHASPQGLLGVMVWPQCSRCFSGTFLAGVQGGGLDSLGSLTPCQVLGDGPGLAPWEREGLSVRVQKMGGDLSGLIPLRQRAAGFSATEDPFFLSPKNKCKSSA